MKILSYHHPNYTYKKHPLFRYCGALQTSHIIETKTGKKHSYRSVMGGINNYTGLCGPNKIFNVLKNRISDVSLLQKSTLNTLKREIDNNKICILLIGHGYDQHGKGFNLLKAIVLQHYISIWGYDEKKGGFFVYDSSIKNPQTLPIGNLFIKAPLLKKCWSWGGLGIYNNVLISL